MNNKKIVIVESPAKSRTLSRYLGKDFIVLASMGHLVDLPENRLAVDVNNGFAPEYVVIPGKEKIIEGLRKEAKKADVIYLASDPDREGEAIAWHIARLLGVEDTALRVLFNEITKQAVQNGIANPTQIDRNKVFAQQARRVLDRLVGYKVSPLLWKIVRSSGLSAGRVQSVALKILANREDEIASFVPQEYWTIQLVLSVGGKQFCARVVRLNNEKLKISSEEEALRHKSRIESLVPWKVANIEVKPQNRNPLPPFITSSLQLEASRKLGFSTAKTMQIAQQLYEGVSLPDGPTGLITYMRTDSVRIAEIARASAKKFIKENFGEEYVGLGRFGTAKEAQDAHEAIRPTYITNTPEFIQSYLTSDQYKLYELIWRRFVASQMAPAKLERTVATFRAGEYEAESTAIKVLFPGFLKLWSVQLSDDGEEEKSKIPPLSVNDIVNMDKINPEQHFTEPPPRFNEGTLVRELEKLGIGRPSTYVPIIMTLVQRKYVRRQKRALTVTPLGMTVNELLQKIFPDIFEEKFTARMEEELDAIERGEKSWQSVLDEFYGPFNKKVLDVEAKGRMLVKELNKPLDEECPECGGRLVMKIGRYGRFIACSNYPQCGYKQNANEKQKNPKIQPEVLDEKCPECGGQLIIRVGKYGKFVACTNFPKCSYRNSLRRKAKGGQNDK